MAIPTEISFFFPVDLQALVENDKDKFINLEKKSNEKNYKGELS